MKKLLINENFFSSWNSNMSYILGFIVADGSVWKRKNRKNSYVMNITNKEKQHLEKIQKVMSSRYKLGTKSDGYDNKREYFCIQVSNKQICKDLINLGVSPRKTYNLDPIEVPEKYFPDFVRGFFDGDGSVYIYKVNDAPQIKAGFVSASAPFMVKFNKNLCENLNIPQKTIHKTKYKYKTIPLYTIDFYIDDCQKLAKFMYQNNPTLYLLRKYQTFEKWKSIKRHRYIKQNYPSKIGWRLNQLAIN
ncbi:LAGLIDADG family homing endonuclease [Candidatus Parcubacteria bacterium]|nr:LAGLIDADG family homing endonuclease [Candidatus Parcubacteria bacterium]